MEKYILHFCLAVIISEVCQDSNNSALWAFFTVHIGNIIEGEIVDAYNVQVQDWVLPEKMTWEFEVRAKDIPNKHILNIEDEKINFNS